LFSNQRRLSRVALAIGGFLIMAGMILLGIFALALFKIIDVSAFMDTQSTAILMLVLLIVGVLDVVSAILLTRG